MGSSILLKYGGAGSASSDELTATANDILIGKTAVTSDSNDGIITGTLDKMNGGIWTPTKSTQTIQCANKVMVGNIQIGAVPSGYINVSGGSYLVNGATLGPLVNRGVTNTAPERHNGTVLQEITGYTKVWGNCGIAGWEKYELATASNGKYYFGGYYSGDTLCFKGSIDLTPFTTCIVSISMAAQSKAEFVFSIINLAKNTLVRCLDASLYYSSGGSAATANYTVNIPLSGVNGHHYIAMYGYHGNGISGTYLNSVRLV